MSYDTPQNRIGFVSYVVMHVSRLRMLYSVVTNGCGGGAVIAVAIVVAVAQSVYECGDAECDTRRSRGSGLERFHEEKSLGSSNLLTCVRIPILVHWFARQWEGVIVPQTKRPWMNVERLQELVQLIRLVVDAVR